jgi:hypothetical protein
MWAALYHQDDGNLDEITKDKITKADVVGNVGAKARWAFTKYSRQFEMFGQIHAELFNQPKLIPGKYELRMKFYRNSPEFCLMAIDDTKRYNIVIDDAALYLCVKKVAPEVRAAHELALTTKFFKYPVSKVLMKFLTKSAGQMDINEPNLFKGTLPRRIVIGLVDSEAMNGSLHKNPFNFKHFDTRSVELRKNGQQLPFEQIDVNYTDNRYLQSYLTLFNGTQKLFANESIGITVESYGKGNTLMVFDISADQNSSNNLNLVREGTVSLTMKLGTATPNAIVIIVYAEYEAIIEIDKDGLVHHE